MGLHIYGKLEEKVKGLRIKDTMFYPIPYLHPAQVAQVYEQPCATQEEAFRIFVKIFICIRRKIYAMLQ